MKTHILIPTLGALVITAASAKPGADRPERNAAHQPPAAILEKFDLDKDGKISPEERKAARDSIHARFLDRFDTDKDGQLSDDEKAAARQQMEAQRAELLAKYDEDNDGKLNPEERSKAIAAGEFVPPPHRPRPARGSNKGDRQPGGDAN